MKSQELRCQLQCMYRLGSSALTKGFLPYSRLVLLLGNMVGLSEGVTSNALISDFCNHI